MYTVNTFRARCVQVVQGTVYQCVVLRFHECSFGLSFIIRKFSFVHIGPDVFAIRRLSLSLLDFSRRGKQSVNRLDSGTYNFGLVRFVEDEVELYFCLQLLVGEYQ